MTAPHDASGVHTVIGVDAGLADLRDADHLVHDLADALGLSPDTLGRPAGVIACTHLIRTPDHRGTAVSLALPDPDMAETTWHRLAALHRPNLTATLGPRRLGPPEGTRPATLAATEHAHRRSGRAVLFPGAAHLTGTVTVADLLTLTAIDRLTVLGHPSPTDQPPAPTTRILTRDHIRPEWQTGHLTLALLPAPDNTLAPFEVPDPTPCCAGHS
ncbi:hypothetical protein IAG44_35430 [Streptomyces roseirectus]|uniref:Uncharacterized protein n=1 Tax=Streptomyces roseirectus TaxID=2768066 RepID=A0A7H0IN62_9ACTN|nr:hypothetical protein [Streptomyces roseirectus]QNP74228.1 hypothetical protein IAG44_35430 [Streptomyces roseirectus]